MTVYRDVHIEDRLVRVEEAVSKLQKDRPKAWGPVMTWVGKWISENLAPMLVLGLFASGVMALCLKDWTADERAVCKAVGAQYVDDSNDFGNEARWVLCGRGGRLLMLRWTDGALVTEVR